MAGAGAPVAPRPCQVTSCCRLCPGALVGLGAEVLGVLGGAVGEVLTLRLGALLGGVGGAAGHLLGDLLAPVQGLLPGLLDLVLDLIGHRPQPLVLHPSAGHGQAGQEPERDRADSKPERVLLGQPNRPLGLLLDLATAGGSIAHPGGRVAHCIAGPGRGPDHGLLGSGSGATDLVLDVVHRLAHLVLGPRGHIGLVATASTVSLISALVSSMSWRIWSGSWPIPRPPSPSRWSARALAGRPP